MVIMQRNRSANITVLKLRIHLSVIWRHIHFSSEGYLPCGRLCATQDLFRPLVDTFSAVKKFIDSRRHQGFHLGIQTMMNSISEAFANLDAGGHNITALISDAAKQDLLVRGQALLTACNALQPLAKGGANGQPWHAGFPAGTPSDEEIKAYLTETLDKVPQIQLGIRAEALVKDWFSLQARVPSFNSKGSVGCSVGSHSCSRAAG